MNDGRGFGHMAMISSMLKQRNHTGGVLFATIEAGPTAFTKQHRDEYEEYLSKPARPCDNPLEWWKAHRQEYPRLSQMALDLFSTPMMSAECERVFSSAKNLITDHRNGLKEDIIEACTLLRHWFRDLGTRTCCRDFDIW